MKLIFKTFCIIFLLISCKSDKKETNETVEKELSIAQKIANANGFEKWKQVSEIQFTFNVDRDTSHFERSWTWKPKTDEVTLISGKDTITYNRKSVDSLSMDADKGFINDKYWLLAPFQLVWDKTANVSNPSKAIAPISKTELQKVTITYPNQGGYTPGDAYDLYLDEQWLIREWVYRKSNSPEPSLITTWEDYEDFNGIKISKTHKKTENNWKLYFSNIQVIN